MTVQLDKTALQLGETTLQLGETTLQTVGPLNLNALQSLNLSDGDQLPYLVTALSEQGVGCFDPFRFRYIESLSHKAQAQREIVRQRLLTKAQYALREYLADFHQARKEAEQRMTRMVSDYPSSQGQAEQLFASGDYDGLRALQRQLVKNTKPGLLAELSQALIEKEDVGNDQPGELSFDDLLRQQEAALIQSSGNSVPEDQALTTIASSQSTHSGELQSVRRFREAWIKRNFDKLVSQAIKDGPENPGPLNPQMLIIRSLSTMRDISPDYLYRYIAYLDTLLWLQQAGEQLGTDDSQKKAGGTKAKASGRIRSKR